MALFLNKLLISWCVNVKFWKTDLQIYAAKNNVGNGENLTARKTLLVR